MASRVKGGRKPGKSPGKEFFTIGGIKIGYDVLIAVLMAAFYAFSVIAARLQSGMSAVMVSAIIFVAFIAFAYFMKIGADPRLRNVQSLTYVFLGLSVISLAWQLLLYFNVVDAAKIGPLAWALAVGVVNAILSLIIIAAIIFVEKVPLKDIYVRLGERLNIAIGVVGFLLCAIISVIVAYFIFGGNVIGQDKFVEAIAVALVFGVLGGVFEELLFRGLLLGRAVPVFGESYGNIYQALVFGAFEAVVFYTATSMAFDLAFIILIAMITGFYWGRSTLRTKSLWSPMLIHAGFYMLIMLPILVGILVP
jgi:uncharacterized protein